MTDPYPRALVGTTYARNQWRADLQRLLAMLTDGNMLNPNVVESASFPDGVITNPKLNDNKIVHHSGSGSVQTLESTPTTVVDGGYFSTGRPNKLRLTSSDVNATSLYSADGSGYLSKDGATQNISLASTKTISVGGTTIVNSSAEVPLTVVPDAQTWRTIYSSFTESDFPCTTPATEKTAWSRTGTWFTIIYLSFVRESTRKDRYLRLTCELRSNTAGLDQANARIELDDENGHTITGTTLATAGTTWVFHSQNTDINSLDTGRNILCQVRLQRASGTIAAELRRVKLELGSNT